MRHALRDGLMALVRGYRLLLSPWLGSACRFEPTCSAYALQALQAHGALGGGRLTLTRLARCHPLCAGGHDPVPAVLPRLFSSLLERSATSAGHPPAASCRSAQRKTSV